MPLVRTEDHELSLTKRVAAAVHDAVQCALIDVRQFQHGMLLTLEQETALRLAVEQRVDLAQSQLVADLQIFKRRDRLSFEKLRGAEISLGPEMKSTGECLGIAKTFNEALYKAFIGAGIRLPKHKQMIITVKDEDKKDIIPIAKRFEAQGYRIFATRGTANVLTENGIKVTRTNKLEQPSPNLMDLILGHKIDVVIDTPPQGVEHQKDGFVIRRNAIETGVNVLTSLDTAEALVTSLENTDLNNLTLVDIAKIDNR